MEQNIQEQIGQLRERVAALEAAAEKDTEWAHEWRETIIKELEQLNDGLDRLELLLHTSSDEARAGTAKAIGSHLESCNMAKKATQSIHKNWRIWLFGSIMAILTALNVYLAWKKK